jgi:glutathione S-transferase
VSRSAYEEGDLALFETGAIVFHIAELMASVLLRSDLTARPGSPVRE